jgi:hypothetical protein
MRSVERPRFIIFLLALGLVLTIALTGLGVLIGRASVEDKGPTPAQLRAANATTAATKRELASVRADLTSRVRELEQSASSWRERAERVERLTTRWRKRARRAERR